MENGGKNLIVIFPGRGYTADMPLLYYAGLKYYVKGYENVRIDYGGCVKDDKPFEDIIADIKKAALEQIKGVDFSIYDDVVFISKSLGTVIAVWLADTLNINARHIYLTPIYATLQYIKKGKNINAVIAGTKDKSLETSVLKAHCEREGKKLELIEGADHSLETMGDAGINIDILKKVVEFY